MPAAVLRCFFLKPASHYYREYFLRMQSAVQEGGGWDGLAWGAGSGVWGFIKNSLLYFISTTVYVSA